jgi:hypothetical protein
MMLKMLKMLNPFCFLAAFDLGAMACPFIPFCPGSGSLPLLSTAIFYSIQLLKKVALAES